MKHPIRQLILLTIAVLATHFLIAQPKQTISAAVQAKSSVIYSAYRPANYAQLNHTQVMFEYPAQTEYGRYSITIEQAVLLNEKSKVDTTWVLVAEQTDYTSATLVSGLNFASSYRWKVEFVASARDKKWLSEYHYFSIISSPLAVMNNSRLKVARNKMNDAAVIAIDKAKAMYDRQGNPVWVLPEIQDKVTLTEPIADLRITPQGTFTFLSGTSAYDVTADGKVIWSGPNNRVASRRAQADFHFGNLIRLSSGNYMTMGNEVVKYHSNDQADSVIHNYGYIAEYTPQGSLVWQWRSKLFFEKESTTNPKNYTANFHARSQLTSFAVDPKNGLIYAVFRDFPEIVRIDKMTGRFSSTTIGKEKGYSAVAAVGKDSLALYQLSIESPTYLPAVPLMMQWSSVNPFWSYNCKTNGRISQKVSAGGNCELLTTGNVLISHGNTNWIQEVTPDKTIVWEAQLQLSDKKEGLYSKSEATTAHLYSSLYPCYFTIDRQAELLNTTQNVIRICNEGTEDDEYIISWYAESNRQVKKVEQAGEQIVKIKAGEMELIRTLPAALQAFDGAVEVRVMSKRNTQLVRALVV